MKALDDFLQFVLPHVPGYALPTAQMAIRQAAIEFCTRSEAIQEISELPIAQGVSLYEVEVPNQQLLCNVLEVAYEGKPLDAVSWPVPDLPPGRPMWSMKPLPGVAEITILPAPSPEYAGMLSIRAAFKPTPEATQLADDLFNDWSEAVAHGALKRMYAMPGQPFTSATNVALSTAAFEECVSRARLVARSKRLVTSRRVRPNPLA